jgi:hypothetical protein
MGRSEGRIEGGIGEVVDKREGREIEEFEK